MITEILVFPLLFLMAISPWPSQNNNKEQIVPFDTYTRYKTKDSKLYFEFYSNLEFGTGKAKIGNDYEAITFKVIFSDNDRTFLINFDDLGCEATLNFSKYFLSFYSGNDLFLLDATWKEWSSSYSKTAFDNIEFDAKHYYDSTFMNPYYDLEMRYDFEGFDRHDMKGVGKYDGLSFSFLPNDGFRILYKGKESSGTYETTKKAMYLTFVGNSLFEDTPGLRMPMYVE